MHRPGWRRFTGEQPMRKARTDAAEQGGPESLDAFLARIQAARLADGLVVT